MGEGPSVKFRQSPQQAHLQGLTDPYWSNLFGGQMPPMYNVPGMPDVQSMFASTMPTGDWYANLDPSIRAGIMAPFQDVEKQLVETLGAKGMTGSPASPYSGSAATGVGQYWADVAPQMATTAWGMMQPGLMAQAQAGYGSAMTGWQADLARNIAGYQQSMLPYQMLLPATQLAQPYPTVDPGSPGFGDIMGNVIPGLAMGWGFGGFPGIGQLGTIFGQNPAMSGNPWQPNLDFQF